VANGTPLGSIHTCHHPLGWIQSEILFPSGIFISSNIQNPTKEVPVILVQDGHYSHSRNLEVITLARENHVGGGPTASQDGWKKFLAPAGISSLGSSSP